MKILKALSRVHGGKYTVQSGIHPGERRGYWLIMQSFHTNPSGGISRSAQIHQSWAMRHQLAAGSRRTLSEYSLVYVFEGRGLFQDEHRREPLPVEAGDVLCLFPGIGHAYGPRDGEFWNEINLEFSGPVFDVWMGAGLLDPAHPVHRLARGKKERSHWLKRFHDVALPLARSVAEPTLADAGRLVALIAEMCAQWQTPREEADIEWARLAKERLRSLPPEQALDLKQMAQPFGLGEQAYRKKFKKLCGITPSLFRSRSLVERACLALIQSNASIKQIAYESGFGSEFYFSRRFRQITGMSPGEYRRRASG